LKTVTTNKLGGETFIGGLETIYCYTAVGTLDTVTLPNGVVTEYNYDALNRLVYETIKKTISGVTTLLQTFAYSLNSDGNRNQLIEHVYNDSGTLISSSKTTWTYDALGRLLTEHYDEGQNGWASGNDYLDTYTLDLVGNRIQKKHQITVSTTETTNYTYNARDLLMIETGNENVTYTYDANGSMVSKLVITSSDTTYAIYGYDLRNRMVLVQTDIGNTGTIDSVTGYLYDAAGNRVAELTVGNYTYFLVDNNNHTGYSQIFEESASRFTDAGGNASPTRAYVIGHDVIAQVREAAIEYLLKDGHGSTRILMSAIAMIVQRYAYDAYGNAHGFDASTALTRHLYNNEVFITGTAMYDFRGRPYDPRTGRFPMMDVYFGNNFDPVTLHKYMFANANPIYYIDPNGNMSLGEMSVVSGISGSLIGSVTGYLRGGVEGAVKGAAFGLAIGLAAPYLLYAAGLNIAGYSWSYLGVYLTTAQGVSIAGGLASIAGFTASLNTLQNAHTPSEKAAAMIELAISSVALGFAATGIRTQGFTFKSVNPLKGTENCGNCAVAVDSTLAGHPAQALNSEGVKISLLAKAFANVPVAAGGFRTSNMVAIASELTAAGPGSRGIVFVQKPFQDFGHVFNAQKLNGRIIFVDGQSGTGASAEGARVIMFMRTN